MRVHKLFIVLLIVIIGASSCCQKPKNIERPKLIVGIVVDQMRWDYLYRYYERYGHDGFKRLLRKGYSCQNTMLNYIPSYTGPGHACIYTGSVPSIDGIAGNEWIDNHTGKYWYCVDDTDVREVGDRSEMPSFSPRNLNVTTITDELRLATNFRSRVFGVSLKDRASILPAGHAANAAYWYDDSLGKFVTSTYYDVKYQRPSWLDSFNRLNEPDKSAQPDWTLLYPAATYIQSTKDSTAYEGNLKGESFPVFPHSFGQMGKAIRLLDIKAMPAGNTLTLDMARACIKGERLGSRPDPDFLCINLASTDYAGHIFGPNSMELEDMYLRLDKEIAGFLEYLDNTVGSGNYLLFLTADHGAAHNPLFLDDHKIPGGICFNLTDDLNSYLRGQFGVDSPLVSGILNNQVYLNEQYINSDTTLYRDDIKYSIIQWLNDKLPGTYHVPVSYVVDMEDMGKTPLPARIRNMVVNGYNHDRSGCIEIILNSGWYESDHYTGITHGAWNPYDTHIPLIWYGWHVPKGESNKPYYMTDISATLAAMLHIQAPSGCIGTPITAITDCYRKKY